MAAKLRGKVWRFAGTRAKPGAFYVEKAQVLAAKKEPARVPLQVRRIGDLGIGTYACEISPRFGLEFKRRSAIPNSFMVSLNHGYYGYLPTPRNYELGGYETWPGTNYLETQASVKMMDTLLAMTKQLAAK
jgi:neutral ceramidase